MSENAVVYARYSSRRQQEQSIEGQLAAAKKYADGKGYTIIAEYCDRAKTGRNDRRAEFQRMLSSGRVTVEPSQFESGGTSLSSLSI